MGKHRGPRWGEWSEWDWDDEYATYYRVRQDDKGKLDYDYRADIPRTPGDVKDLAEELEATTLESEYTTDPAPDAKGKKRDKGKSKANHQQYDEEDTSTANIDHNASYSSEQYYQPADVQEDGYTEADDIDDTEIPQDSQAGYPYAYEDEPVASSSTYGPPEDDYQGQPAYYATDDTHQQHSNEPTSGSLDGRYGVQPTSEFKPGKIFKVYWSEPKGSKPATISNPQEEFQLGQLVYTGFRRFIVIATDVGHSTCVPILTYESRACAKPGVKAHKHGIIHDERQRPRTVSHEPELGFKPVRARMYVGTETLSRESRVNYSKSSTVEHNAPVWFIGEIVPDDWHIATKAFNKCWEKMNHGHRSHRRRHRS